MRWGFEKITEKPEYCIKAQKAPLGSTIIKLCVSYNVMDND